ncbi:MAG: radical SAM protein, partial [Endomicrobium sp.]|nr:radical SAM protein [Endomicrobium sp.]
MILFFRNILKYVNYNILGKEKYIRTISKRNIFEFANFLFQLCKVTFETFILKKVYIPYVEVAVTTRCSLKCKHCSYYIPITDEKCHSSISFEEYKLYIDNLLKNIVSLQTLTLIGGEPLLNKDFDKILIYSLYHKKIESVYIVSNGTIDFREDLTTILKKFSNKAVVWLSNYLSNEDLLPKLKTTNIIKNLMESGVTVHCLASQWYPVSQIRYNNRSKP